MRVGILSLALALASGTSSAQAKPASGPRFSFVVLGHVRGEDGKLSPKLGELLDRVRGVGPAFVVLTGDMIWGDVNTRPTDPKSLERQWTELDSALATLGVPVYRTPGNHDINDVVSRDVYHRRYGRLPTAIWHQGSRLVLVQSAWDPADGDTAKHAFIRGKDLDSAQVGFLRRELAQPDSARHTFVFMHHLLWWEPDSGDWWRTVQPVLAAGQVEAVFSGDYGPLKFSTMERDRVRYYQCSMETPVPLRLLQLRPNARVLSSQFDCFLEVRVDGPRADVLIHTLAETSSGQFTPARWREINEQEPAPRPWAVRLQERLLDRRLWAGVGAIVAAFVIGWWVGRRRQARPVT